MLISGLCLIIRKSKPILEGILLMLVEIHIQCIIHNNVHHQQLQYTASKRIVLTKEIVQVTFISWGLKPLQFTCNNVRWPTFMYSKLIYWKYNINIVHTYDSPSVMSSWNYISTQEGKFRKFRYASNSRHVKTLILHWESG